jgi:hypothetical protein
MCKILAQKIKYACIILVFVAKDWRLHESANVNSADSLFAAANKGVPKVQQIFVHPAHPPSPFCQLDVAKWRQSVFFFLFVCISQ